MQQATPNLIVENLCAEVRKTPPLISSDLLSLRGTARTDDTATQRPDRIPQPETHAAIIGAMASDGDRLLRFSSVSAGGDGHWHAYYGAYYVGSIHRNPAGWCAWHLQCSLGLFPGVDEAKQALEECYYGPSTVAGVSVPETEPAPR